MTFINIAKDDIKPLFINPADITAIQVFKEDIVIHNSQGRLLHAKLKDWNLDVTDVVQKLKDAGADLLPLTTRHQGAEYPNFIAPSAVTYATISLPDKDGRVGAIFGVKGAYRLETWEGGTEQSEIDNLIEAVRKTKTLFEFQPKEAYSRWYRAAMLYIDPASVTQMNGAFDYNQINVFFENSGSLDVQVAYHNQFDETSFQNRALAIYNSKSYTGPQGIEAVNAIAAQLEKDAIQARVDFVKKIAGANGNLLNASTTAQAAFLRKEEISTISFYDEKDRGIADLHIQLKAKQGQQFGDSLSLSFKNAAERKTAVASLLKGHAPRLKP